MKTYPAPIQEYLTTIRQEGWQWRTIRTPIGWSRDIARNHPELIPVLIQAAIDVELTQYEVQVSAHLSSLLHEEGDASAAALIPYALDALSQNPGNEPAKEVLWFFMDENPTALHPYLRTLLLISDRAETNCAPAWRGAEPQEALYLHQIYAEATTEEPLRRLALDALLEARYEPVLQAVLPDVPLQSWLDIGYTVESGVLRKLYSDTLYHLRFCGTDGDCGSDEPLPTEPGLLPEHPTWYLPVADKPPLKLGGVAEGLCTCRSCGETIQHLLTLEPVPGNLEITGMPRVVLAVCLSCVGWENGMQTAFYQHDEAGTAVKHINFDGPQITPQFPAGPLVETVVRLSPTPTRWFWQGWRHRENISRLGGYPAWIQQPDPHYPTCPTCQQAMPFLLQLDSDLAINGTPFAPLAESWMWGSGGIAYLHWCDTCRISALHWQCT